MEHDTTQKQTAEGEPRAISTRRFVRPGRRGVLAIAAGAAVVTGAAVAVGATQPSGPAARNQAIIADAAGRLGIQPSRLTTAVQQALIDQVNQRVTQGTITRAEADALIARIRAGSVPLFGGGYRPGGFGSGRFGAGRFGLGPGRGLVRAAASYLGLTPQQLRSQLRTGKSLASITTARGKTVAGLKQAITTAVTARLDQLVTRGRITKTQQQAILSRLSSALDGIIQRSPRVDQPGLGGAPGIGDAGPGGPPPSGAQLPPLVAPA